MSNNLKENGWRITTPNRRVDNYVVYELFLKDTFVCSAYGSAAVLSLGLLADHLENSKETGKAKLGFDLIMGETGS